MFIFLLMSGCCSFKVQEATITPGVEYILTVETLDSARTHGRACSCCDEWRERMLKI